MMLHGVPGGLQGIRGIQAGGDGIYQLWRQSKPNGPWQREGEPCSKQDADKLAGRFSGFGRTKVVAVGESPTAAPRSTRTHLYT